MLRNLFLMRNARRYVGKVVSFGNGFGGLILHADMLGVAYEDPEGDRVHLAWADVKAIFTGPKVEKSYRRCRDDLKALRSSDPRPALTPAEIAEILGEDEQRRANLMRGLL